MLIYKCSQEEKCFKNSFRSYSSQKLEDSSVKVIEHSGEYPEYTEKTEISGSFHIPRGLPNPVNLGRLLNFSGSADLQSGVTTQPVGRRDLIR